MSEVDLLLTKYPFLHRVEPFGPILIGRETETNMLLESLLKQRLRNSVLVGEAGCGKTAIIENLAGIIGNKYTILEFGVASSLCSTRYRGEFEEKIVHCLDDVSKHKNIVLFIDEIHTIIKAGDTEGAVSLSNIMKPYLSSGKITIIGATTKREYEDIIKQDLAMKRRLSPVFVGLLDEKSVISILNEFAGGGVEKKMLKYVYKRSQDIPGGCVPDISIEVLDRCMARMRRLGEGAGSFSCDVVDEVCQSLSE